MWFLIAPVFAADASRQLLSRLVSIYLFQYYFAKQTLHAVMLTYFVLMGPRHEDYAVLGQFFAKNHYSVSLPTQKILL